MFLYLESLTFASYPNETREALTVKTMASWNAHPSMMARTKETWSYPSERKMSNIFSISGAEAL